jgi:hypothetical protein
MLTDTALQLYIIHVITYWLSCVIFMTADRYLPDSNGKVYRIAHRDRSFHPPADKKVNAAWLSVVNQIIALPIALGISP